MVSPSMIMKWVQLSSREFGIEGVTTRIWEVIPDRWFWAIIQDIQLSFVIVIDFTGFIHPEGNEIPGHFQESKSFFYDIT